MGNLLVANEVLWIRLWLSALNVDVSGWCFVQTVQIAWHFSTQLIHREVNLVLFLYTCLNTLRNKQDKCNQMYWFQVWCCVWFLHSTFIPKWCYCSSPVSPYCVLSHRKLIYGSCDLELREAGFWFWFYSLFVSFGLLVGHLGCSLETFALNIYVKGE